MKQAAPEVAVEMKTLSSGKGGQSQAAKVQEEEEEKLEAVDAAGEEDDDDIGIDLTAESEAQLNQADE